MKIRKKDYKDLMKYYLVKRIMGGSVEARYIEEEIKDRYLRDVQILKAIRDFCPLEYLSGSYDKYSRWLYGTGIINIFQDIENFTKELYVLDIPREMFSDEEADILTNVLRRAGFDFGLTVRRTDVHTLVAGWKKEYILNEDYEASYRERSAFARKFDVERRNLEERKCVENEIEERLVPSLREKLIAELPVSVIRVSGKKDYKIPELVEILLRKDSPIINIFVAEMYYRFDLKEKAYRILSETLELYRIDQDTAKRVKKLRHLVKSKKPKDRFLAMEEFTEERFEDIQREDER